ncbi:MAG TPA: hypothetical protein VFJ58_24015 [Armatimonadota bacterium]|nr:hypothetical protein [Armatimonadota bacterium]
MNKQAYENWAVLHRRVVAGESLNESEQAAYEAGRRELDHEDRMDGNLEMIRTLRAQIREAETVQRELRTKERELDTRIKTLESRLDERTRQLLGIGS